MSDVFVSAKLNVDLEVVAENMSWTIWTRVWKGETGIFQWAIARVDDPELWGPAYDCESRVRVLLNGRIALEENEWRQGEDLPYEGGLASKIILDRWLNGDKNKIDDFNGSFSIIIIDEKSQKIHIWSDRFGFIPLYSYEKREVLFSSHPDILSRVLRCSGMSCEIDKTTIAEFLRTGTATHPYSYWKEINQCDPGTNYSFTVSYNSINCSKRQYWGLQNYKGPYLSDRKEIVSKLTHALKSAIRKRTLPRLGKISVLLSSGADSRTILFGACNPEKVLCHTLFDERNEELLGSIALAELANAEHKHHKRAVNYYFNHASEAIRISGGMWSIDSAHYGGLATELKNAGVVLTGCYADYLLKGLAYSRTHVKIFGKNLPIYQLIKPETEFYQPFSEINPSWENKVSQRSRKYFSSLDFDAENTIAEREYLRLAPLSREPDSSGRLFLGRTVGHDFFMADKDILDLVASIHPKQKLNGIPFGMAVNNIVGKKAKHIKNNNYGAPVGSSELKRIFYFIAASLKRKLHREGSGQPFEKDPNSVATVGSWPNYARIISLNKDLELWLENLDPAIADFLFDVLGLERSTWSMQDWAKRDSFLFLRFFTVYTWLEQRSAKMSAEKDI